MKVIIELVKFIFLICFKFIFVIYFLFVRIFLVLILVDSVFIKRIDLIFFSLFLQYKDKSRSIVPKFMNVSQQ